MSDIDDKHFLWAGTVCWITACLSMAFCYNAKMSKAEEAEKSAYMHYYSLGINALKLTKFDINQEKFKPGRRDPYAPEYDGDWNYRSSANFDVSLFTNIYWNNYVHTESTTSGSVKTVGWEWTGGIKLFPQVDLFTHHHSQHIMESFRPTKDGKNTFPIEDSFGVKFRIIDDCSKTSLFK
jgi:hypothetical protein